MVQAGSVHVYSGATLAVLYQLFGTFAGQNLGDAISGAGDVNGDGFDDFVVGSGKSSPGGVHYAGIAWVYSGADGSVIHQINGSWADGNFGYTVSGAGDVDGDGFGDFMVGGYNNN